MVCDRTVVVVPVSALLVGAEVSDEIRRRRTSVEGVRGGPDVVRYRGAGLGVVKYLGLDARSKCCRQMNIS